MTPIIQRLRNTIDKLNQIDIGSELRKLKQLDLKALKNLSISDFKKQSNPMMISIVGSFAMFGASIYAFSLPEWHSWAQNSQTLNQYEAESQELPLLRTTLNELLKQQDETREEFELVLGFVSEESVELFTSKFFSETSKRSKVRLLALRPMSSEGPFECVPTDPADQVFNDVPPLDQLPEKDQMNDDASPNDLEALEPTFASDLSRLFKVNRFELMLDGNYMNLMDYLRYLNQYQQTISPVCFDVKSKPIEPSPDAISGIGDSSKPRYVGDVSVRLIVDVPQREAPNKRLPEPEG